MKTKAVLMSSALAVTLYGCAGTGGEPPLGALKVRPASTNADTGVTLADLLYGDAVSAINRRDYARALDLLQAAREKAPGDVRILNAFGVVYDKLGRFDLSQRYYAQAQSVDPASTIVAQNLAYSKALQGDRQAFALAEVVEPKTAPPPVSFERARPRQTQAEFRQDQPVMKLAPPSPAMRIASAPAATAPRAEPVRIIAPVALSYASEPFIVRLASARRASVKPVNRPEFIAAAQPSRTSAAQQAAAIMPSPSAPLPTRRAVAMSTPWAIQHPPSRAAVALAAPIPSAPPHMETRPTLAAAPQPPRASAAQQAAGITPTAATSLPTRLSAAMSTPRATPQPPSPGGAFDLAASPTKAPAHVSAVAPAARAHASASAAPRLMADGARPAGVMKAPRKAAAALVVASAAPPPERAAVKVGPPRAVGLLGRPVMVVYNGSGRRSADQLRAHLARRGWTLALTNGRSAAPSITTIRYAAGSQRIAFALAHSLRIPVKLEACRARCSGVTIMIGGRGVLRTAAANSQPSRKAS